MLGYRYTQCPRLAFLDTEILYEPVVHGAMGCGQKSFNLVSRYHLILSGFLVNGHLSRVSRQSRLSANDRGDKDMVPGLCSDLLTFNLRLRKTSSRRSSDEI